MNRHLLGLDELAKLELDEAADALDRIPSDPAQDLEVAQLQATIGVGRALLYLAHQLERHP